MSAICAIRRDNLAPTTHGYISTASVSAGIIMLLGKTFARLSWLPKAEMHVVTAGIGLLNCLYPLGQVVTPSPQDSI